MAFSKPTVFLPAPEVLQRREAPETTGGAVVAPVAPAELAEASVPVEPQATQPTPTAGSDAIVAWSNGSIKMDG